MHKAQITYFLLVSLFWMEFMEENNYSGMPLLGKGLSGAVIY
jgi:hypothetical protein